MVMTEIWKPLSRFGNVIEVSNIGNVRRLAAPAKCRNGHARMVAARTLKPRQHPWGYDWFEFSLAGKMYRDFAHRLVMEAFVGPCEEGMFVLHFDNDPKNNNLSNLRYGTPTENCADKLMHGTQKTGEQVWWSRLKESQIVDIRCRRANGETLESIGKDFGLDAAYVWYVCTGKKWPNAGGPLTMAERVVRFLTDSEKTGVLALRATGATLSEISATYGVSRTQIHNVVRT